MPLVTGCVGVSSWTGGCYESQSNGQGLLIPIKLLEGVREVDILKQEDWILVAPVSSDDPVLQLGKSPIVVDERNAAENHDRYIYQP